MPIYTRTGDKGQTSLFGGKRVLKSDKRVDAYGTVDELNTFIGVTLNELSGNPDQEISVETIKKELDQIQNDLFEIGSALATPSSMPINDLENRVKKFEQLIDKLTVQMPVLQNFILPGGGKTGSLLHIDRAISRRAERRVIALMQAEYIDQGIVIYLNRLSDLLFTMARFMNYHEEQKEVVWKKR